MNKQEYVDFLSQRGKKQVWAFTKQTANFQNVINSVKLFEDWKYTAANITPLQTYYERNAHYYNIFKNHRSLIIAQFFGLLTCDSHTYEKEETTQAYNCIVNENEQENLNKIITEQLLKFKVTQITSRGEREITHKLYPIIFIYQVLKKLKVEHNINELRLNDLWLFVMTRENHSQIEECVQTLLDQERYRTPYDLLSEYHDYSRIDTLMDNLNLFISNEDTIKINPELESIMDEFLATHTEIFDKLDSEDEYINFLQHNQNFNISLIQDKEVEVEIENNVEEIEEDCVYTEEVDKSVNFSETEIQNLMNNSSKELNISSHTSTKIQPNTKVGALSLQMYEYKCCVNPEHKTFTSKRTKNAYMEAHHLIPRKYQQKYYDELHVNIDCVQNLVSLCPNCHRTLHHGIFAEKEEVLKALYELKKDDLESIGINITLDTLMSYYI